MCTLMQAAHQLEFKKYDDEKLAKGLKRSSSLQSIDDKQQSKKQCTFDTMFSRRQPSADTVKSLIFDYIVAEMKPLRTVECQSFKRLCTGLCPTATVMTRTTLTNMVSTKYEEMVQMVTGALSEVDVVCTTADLWSSQNRSFLGMTVHWLERNELKRMSAAIACKRFKGSHTYDKIASAIQSVHVQYGIEYKVAKTCIDNGSNMVKAFNEFQVKLPPEEYEVQQSDSDNEMNSSSDAEESSDESTAAGTIDTSQLLEPADELVSLPPHMRCCTHTLNLVVTTDASKAGDDKVYKRIYHVSMAKASAIWNLTSRSTKAADAAFDILGYRFQVTIKLFSLYH